MGAIGLPELIVVLAISSLSLVPVAVAIWVIITVKRIRDSQRAMELKLEALAQALRRS